MRNPTEELRAALANRGWSAIDLAWVLEYTTEAAENLLREPRVTPTLALRLEAALEIPARDWLESVTPQHLWLLSEQMEQELTWIRRRRSRLTELKRHEGVSAGGP